MDCFGLEVESLHANNFSHLNLTSWKLSEDVHGPILALFVFLELILALVFNSYIIIHSLYYREKSFKRSSTVLLFNLALSDLVMTLLYMPFLIVALSYGEWTFGRTDCVRKIFCQIHGFVFFHSCTVSTYTLGVIAIDRFLYIVKGDIYHKLMSIRIVNCVVVAIWIYAALVSFIPNYSCKFSGHSWAFQLGGCILLPNTLQNILLLSAVPSLPLTIITITSIWTFVFTRRFLKKNLKRHERSLTRENMEIHKSIYNSRIKNLLGIFGTLLLFHLISWSLFFVSVVYAAIVSWERTPTKLVACAFVLFLFNNISNPIIQIYFRNDLRESLQETICRCGRRKQIKRQSVSISYRSSRATSISTIRQSSVFMEQISLPDIKSLSVHEVLPPAKDNQTMTANENSTTSMDRMPSSHLPELPVSFQSDTNSDFNIGKQNQVQDLETTRIARMAASNSVVKTCRIRDSSIFEECDEDVTEP